MKKYFSSRAIKSLGFALMMALMFGCSDTDDTVPEEIKDSLYFEFTLDGNKYRSEIKESNLLPGSGIEKNDNSSDGMNSMMYYRYSNNIWMSYNNKCGTASGKDCVEFLIQVPDFIKEGTYPSLFTYGIRVNEQDFVQRYNGPKVNDLPEDLRVDVVITKYDEVNNMVEGTVKGGFYRFQDPLEEVVYLTGEFRVYLFTN